MQRTFVKRSDFAEACTIAAAVGHEKLLITCEEVEEYCSKHQQNQQQQLPNVSQIPPNQPQSNFRAKGVLSKTGERSKHPKSEGRLHCAAAHEAARGTRGLV